MNIMFSLENTHRIASHKYSIIKNYPQKNINYKFLKILIYIYAFSFGIAIINSLKILSYYIGFLFNKFYLNFILSQKGELI